MSAQGTVGTLERIFGGSTARVLDICIDSDSGYTIEEVAAKTGLSNRTVWDIITKLRRQGIITVINNRSKHFVYDLTESEKARRIRALSAIHDATNSSRRSMMI